MPPGRLVPRDPTSSPITLTCAVMVVSARIDPNLPNDARNLAGAFPAMVCAGWTAR
jgi:hypothetical protein